MCSSEENTRRHIDLLHAINCKNAKFEIEQWRRQDSNLFDMEFVKHIVLCVVFVVEDMMEAYKDKMKKAHEIQNTGQKWNPSSIKCIGWTKLILGQSLFHEIMNLIKTYGPDPKFSEEKLGKNYDCFPEFCKQHKKMMEEEKIAIWSTEDPQPMRYTIELFLVAFRKHIHNLRKNGSLCIDNVYQSKVLDGLSNGKFDNCSVEDFYLQDDIQDGEVTILLSLESLMFRICGFQDFPNGSKFPAELALDTANPVHQSDDAIVSNNKASTPTTPNTNPSRYTNTSTKKRLQSTGSGKAKKKPKVQKIQFREKTIWLVARHSSISAVIKYVTAKIMGETDTFQIQYMLMVNKVIVDALLEKVTTYLCAKQIHDGLLSTPAYLEGLTLQQVNEFAYEVLSKNKNTFDILDYYKEICANNGKLLNISTNKKTR